MTLFALQGAVELGLIYARVALGLFVSYRVLDIPDLTVDGSFTLGAFIYRIIYAFVMARGMAASDLKLISAVIVTLAISYPVVTDRYRLHKLMKEAAKDVGA